MESAIDEEWENYITNSGLDEDSIDSSENKTNNIADADSSCGYKGICPESSDIYISTKSKIAYLTDPIDLRIFWDIPVINYGTPANGVIKKQIKINSTSPEELDLIQQKLKKEEYFDEQIITSIDNPTGRIKFKDIRKITVGLSKKDILSYRSKKKQAFYNCFVIILRIKIQDIFKEFHVKVFNTGKLEIPGIQSEESFESVLKTIVNTIQPYISIPVTYKKTSDTVLINSNFNCGFFVNREVLYDILKYKYNIHAIYDPCSYPGIQCKFYYNNDLTQQTGRQISKENFENYKNIVQVSFMIFRTGSVLIVGMCNDDVLLEIYKFLKTLLKTEFQHICQKVITPEMAVQKVKKHKLRKKTIYISTEKPVSNTVDKLQTKNKLLNFYIVE